MYGSIGQNGLYAANETRIFTPKSIQDVTAGGYHTLTTDLKEKGASSVYGNPITGLGGSSPSGLGYTFGDSWKRTQRDVMEFQMPAGQQDTINTAMRYSFENAFVAKAIKLKTNFICKGLQNQTGDDNADQFFDQVHDKLNLEKIYRQAVNLYLTAGLVPILLPAKDKPLDWVQILDPRMVRTETNYGKTVMYLVADQRMKNALADQQGRIDPRNKDYWNAMPLTWRRQLSNDGQRTSTGEVLIKLDEGSYLVIDARDNPYDRVDRQFDGSPLQPYFAACAQYRMLMAGDFATAFLAKNLIALVSIGDPKAEGKDLYMRPDDSVLSMLQNTFQNPNRAQWIYGDPTLNVRYITPDMDALDNKKYAECKETLKNLLPSPFWYSDGGGAFAAATVEMKQLEEEVEVCQNVFDKHFWVPIHERAAQGRARIAAKHCKAPRHDRSALRDRIADLQAKSTLYSNGGLDIHTLMQEHGYDPEVIKGRLQAQQAEVKKGTYMPAFEGKQGIVATKTYGIEKLQAAAKAKADAKVAGRPSKPGSSPKAETNQARSPRPGGK